MSFDVGVYFNARDSFAEVVKCVERLLQVKLTRTQDEIFGVRYGAEVLGLIITVYEDHGLIDDPDSDYAFSDYKHAIDITIFIASEGDAQFVRATAFFIAHRLYDTHKWPCIVVEETYTKLLQLPQVVNQT